MLLKPDKDSVLVASYRPISLLICLSKLFERIALIRISLWLSSGKSSRSTRLASGETKKDQMFNLIQFVQSAFNRGYKDGSIFIDIEKAFDKVCHASLLFKLNRLANDGEQGRKSWNDGERWRTRAKKLER